MTRLEWALHLASQNFKIFPLKAGAKEPWVEDSWLAVATTDESVIRSFFEEKPGMNYGVCPAENFVIIDVDVKGDKKGDINLAQLESEQSFNEGISQTFSVRSPSGGTHYYLRTRTPVSNAHSIGQDIDVRGNHGYVVGPGCELVEGRCKPIDVPGLYTCDSEDVSIIQAPAWITKHFSTPKEREAKELEPIYELDTEQNIDRAKAWLKLREPSIKGHNGDEWALKTAMGVIDFSISEEKTLDLMMGPDWYDGSGWSYEKLAVKVANAWCYRQERPGSKAVGLMDLVDESQYGDIVLEQVEDTRSRLERHTFRDDTLFGRGKRREMIIPELLPAYGIAAIVGARSGGKTTLLIDIAMRLTFGMDWHGVPVKDHYKVVYICGEDDEGAEEIIRGWCKAHNQPKFPKDKFIFLDIITDLMSAEDVKGWAEHLRKVVGGGNKAVLFLDTWQRASSRGGQSKDEDMQKAVHHAEVLARSLNGPMVIAAHPPKGGVTSIMGSSIIENETTAIWHLTSEANGRKLVVDRIKGKGSGNYHLFRFKEQDLGELDSFGRPRTSLYPVKIGGIEFQGAKEVDEERAAYAEVISKLDLERIDIDANSAPYSLKAMSDRMGKLLEDAQDDDKKVFALDLIKTLRERGGVNTFTNTAFYKRLGELFAREIKYDLGAKGHVVLTNKGRGNAQRFVIGTNLIDTAG